MLMDPVEFILVYMDCSRVHGCVLLIFYFEIILVPTDYFMDFLDAVEFFLVILDGIIVSKYCAVFPRCCTVLVGNPRWL